MRSTPLFKLFLLFLTVSTFLPFSAYAKEEKTVLLAILARNKEHVLPRFLKCIKKLDYDKSLITVYINTNNNDDNTQEILEEWVRKNQTSYHQIIFDSHTIENAPSTHPHEWNAGRFKIIAAIRKKSLEMTLQNSCDYYFSVDCDNFLTPCTLKELIKKDKPIIAPLLHPIPEPGDLYSNFFCNATKTGYYKHHSDYLKIFNREKRGTFKVPLVHCTYLINAKYIDQLDYTDETNDYEFIIFSRIARKQHIHQYVCNEKKFGFLAHFHTNVSQKEEGERLSEYLEK